ncbi:MAG: AI-2E family transporter [bacterium]|nr:AI-2E family transporter [bacterium]
MNRKQEILVTISSISIIKVIVFGVGLFLLWYLGDLVLALITSVVIASAIEPGARFLEKYRIPRVVSVIMLYLASFLLFVGIITIFVPPLIEQSIRLSNQLPQQLAQFDLFEGVGGIEPLATQFGLRLPEGLVVGDFYGRIESIISGISGGAIATASTIFGGAFSFVLILVLSFYLSVQKTGVEGFIQLVTPLRHEPYVLDLWRRSQHKIGKWLQGQLLLGFIMGVFTYLLLVIFGVPYPMLLASLAMVAELVPIVGPVLAAIPAIMFGFLESSTTGIAVVVIYIVLNQFENHLLYPQVVKKVVGVPPLLVILALLIGARLGGFLGILISVPVAASIKEIFDDIDKRKHSEREKEVVV